MGFNFRSAGHHLHLGRDSDGTSITGVAVSPLNNFLILCPPVAYLETMRSKAEFIFFLSFLKWQSQWCHCPLLQRQLFGELYSQPCTMIFWQIICLTCTALAEILVKVCSLLEPEIKVEHISCETRMGDSGECHLILFHIALVALQLLPAKNRPFPSYLPADMMGQMHSPWLSSPPLTLIRLSFHRPLSLPSSQESTSVLLCLAVPA